MADRALTEAAFSHYRSGRTSKDMHPDAQRYVNDALQMTEADGLEAWVDGEAGTEPEEPGVVAPTPDNLRLWVVTPDDVLHASEECEFARRLGPGSADAVKHSNLTGGGSAYAGGELFFLCEGAIVINGSSGRYRIATEDEMAAVEKAFTESGYTVWSMGFDNDVNRPRPFGTIRARRVAA